MKMTLVPCVLALATSLAFAQADSQDHAAHHPEGAGSAAAATAPAMPDRFGQQMQMMQDMHRRMQSARSPAEKQALMAEHLKLMQSGMDMMAQMGQASSSMAMGGMAAAPATGTQGNQPGPSDQTGPGSMGGMMAMHGSMERRMAMMEQMMQMMVDREAAMPRR
ncbi:MAG: hypothetical protein ACXWC6_03140 [Ramlibacter sp.]